jgi:hypothetical protein
VRRRARVREDKGPWRRGMRWCFAAMRGREESGRRRSGRIVTRARIWWGDVKEEDCMPHVSQCNAMQCRYPSNKRHKLTRT